MFSFRLNIGIFYAKHLYFFLLFLMLCCKQNLVESYDDDNKRLIFFRIVGLQHLFCFGIRMRYFEFFRVHSNLIQLLMYI